MLKNLIKDGKLPSLYLIINDVIQKKSSGYGYGYGYGYGSYDADKENKNKWWKKFFNFNKHKNNK